MADQRLLASSGPAYYVSTLAPEPFAALGQEVTDASADMDVLVVRGKKSRTKQAFMDEIGAVLQAPWSFGENWDALDDVISGRGYLPGALILVPDAHLLLSEAPADELAKFVSVFDRCIRYYSDRGAVPAQGLGFHIVFQVPPDQRDGFEQRLTAAGAEFERL